MLGGFVTPAAAQAPATQAPQVTVGGVAYLQYLYQLKDTANHNNNFDVTRAYINVIGCFSRGHATRKAADDVDVGPRHVEVVVVVGGVFELVEVLQIRHTADGDLRCLRGGRLSGRGGDEPAQHGQSHERIGQPCVHGCSSRLG